jgi:hypothetical protein
MFSALKHSEVGTPLLARSNDAFVVKRYAAKGTLILGPFNPSPQEFLAEFKCGFHDTVDT